MRKVPSKKNLPLRKDLPSRKDLPLRNVLAPMRAPPMRKDLLQKMVPQLKKNQLPRTVLLLRENLSVRMVLLMQTFLPLWKAQLPRMIPLMILILKRIALHLKEVRAKTQLCSMPKVLNGLQHDLTKALKL